MTTEDREVGMDWPAQAVDQLDLHWRTQLRPRLDGLTDAEYLWEPTPGAWNVHLASDGGAATIDFAYPEPRPAPLTTIAWQLAHVIVSCLGARSASHFGGPPVDYDTFPYATSADEALNREVIHHGAHVAVLRDLWAHRDD